MSPSNNKRARRQDAEGCRSPDTTGAAYPLDTYAQQVMAILFAETEKADAADGYMLPCPFQRRDPRRYQHVKDPACNGRGFKDIADLRDHIKRTHSHRYGCPRCKERYQCRDNQLDETVKAHREKCKNQPSDLSRKPEIMTAEQDSRYFRLDFRRRNPKVRTAEKQPDQYYEICKAIWPIYEDKTTFEKIDMRNRAGATVSLLRLSEVLEDVKKRFQGSSEQVFNNVSVETTQSSRFRTAEVAAQQQQYMQYEPTAYDQLTQLVSIPVPKNYSLGRGVDSAYGSAESMENVNCSMQDPWSGYDPMLLPCDNTDVLRGISLAPDYGTNGYAVGDLDESIRMFLEEQYE